LFENFKKYAIITNNSRGYFMYFIPKKNVSYISDLLVDILAVRYVNMEKGYIKAKIALYHKTYGYFYETRNVRMRLQDIQHWKPIRRGVNNGNHN
jgi:hypothetical protein